MARGRQDIANNCPCNSSDPSVTQRSQLLHLSQLRRWRLGEEPSASAPPASAHGSGVKVAAAQRGSQENNGAWIFGEMGFSGSSRLRTLTLLPSSNTTFWLLALPAWHSSYALINKPRRQNRRKRSEYWCKTKTNSTFLFWECVRISPGSGLAMPCRLKLRSNNGS